MKLSTPFLNVTRTTFSQLRHSRSRFDFVSSVSVFMSPICTKENTQALAQISDLWVPTTPMAATSLDFDIAFIRQFFVEIDREQNPAKSATNNNIHMLHYFMHSSESIDLLFAGRSTKYA